MYIKTILTTTAVSLLFSGCSLLKPNYNDAQMHSYLFDKFDSDEDSRIIFRIPYNRHYCFLEESG